MRQTLFFHVRWILVAAVTAQAAIGQARVPPPSPGVPAGRELGTIDGVVSDTGLAPVQAAFVSILGTKIRVGTGPNGRFRITKIPVGQYLVIVKRVGYRPTSSVVEVPSSDTLRLAYTLERVTEMLDPVVVTERAPSSKLGDFE
ncbi:MAG: carboxypeptidase regulatory-like domain-containing protein, partial [bacterium]